MSQSYNNLSISPILAATDEILGLNTTTQLAGTSLSGKNPIKATVASDTLILALDGGAPVTVTIAQKDNPYDLMASLQAAVRAAGMTAPYTGFTARYDSSLDQYVLTSGTANTNPATPASAVVVSGGLAAAPFKLGTGNGGTESSAAAPYLFYTVRYRFSFPTKGNFGGADIVVYGYEMTTPTDLNELKAIANARASQIKAEVYGQETTSLDSNAINGPVVI